MSAFAIFRVSKHKTAGTIQAASSHMLRSIDTPNANPDKTPDNLVLVGQDDATPADLVQRALADAETKRGKPHGKNRVRALEVMLTASPEWWTQANSTQRAEWRDASTKFLRDTFGAENVVSLIEHRDETSPHLTGFVVPLDPDTGRLNAGRWLDGREKMQRLQDAYAETVQGLGLERGIRGSKAKHKRVSRHYGNINRMIEDADLTIPAPRKPGMFEDKEQWAEEQQAIARDAALRVTQPLADKALAYDREKDRADRAEAALKKARAKADQVRALRLPDVIQALGFEQDPADKKQWRDPERRFRITLDGRKFYDHAANTGGGGAIDLVKHALDADYQRAVSWLADRFGSQDTAADVAEIARYRSRNTVAAAQKARTPFKAPETLNEGIARSFLASRGLDYEYEDDSLAPLPADIRTDARGNIAFLMRDSNGQVQGAELRGTGDTPFKGLALGSSRDAHFIHDVYEPGQSGYRLFITESAIDALSGAEYTVPEKNPNGIKIISTAGARGSITATMRHLASRAVDILVAFDWDKAGQRAASLLIEALTAAFPGKPVKNWLPSPELRQGKDLNDMQMVDAGIRPPDPKPEPKQKARTTRRGRDSGLGD